LDFSFFSLTLAGTAGVKAFTTGIDVNDHLGAGQFFQDFRLDGVAQFVSLFD